jgi:mono/diheme cytochrome c family protein
MKYFIAGYILAVAAAILIFGVRGQKFDEPPRELFNDMDRQSKVMYQEPSEFFADGRASRIPPVGTVPLGFEKPWEKPAEGESLLETWNFNYGTTYVSTGRIGENWGTGIPDDFEIDAAFLAKGRERYDINCKICHGATGAGNGVATNYGLIGVANLQQDTFVQQPDGQIYNTIANGKGLMYGYGANLTLRDRWAIVAYIRALQKAVNGSVEDLTPEQRDQLLAENTEAPAQAGEPAETDTPATSEEAAAPESGDQASMIR